MLLTQCDFYAQLSSPATQAPTLRLRRIQSPATQALTRGSRRIWKPLSSSMPEKVQECDEVVRLALRERLKQRTAEHSVDVPVSQILEEIVEVRFTVEAPRLQNIDGW